MLEGLEVSEVMLNDLEYSGRLDSEYYRPEWLAYENLIKKRNAKPLSSFANFLIGPFGSAFTVENYTEDKTFRYIRGKDVKPMRLMDDDNVYMPKIDFERLSKYSLKKNDLLVSVVGTIGNAAIIGEESLPAIFSCKSTVVRVDGINSHYLLTYLNTKFGKSLLCRKERGAVQKGLNLDDLKRIDIYEAGSVFQEAIAQAYKVSAFMNKSSNSTFEKAENFLLKTFNLECFSPSLESVNIKSFNDSFVSSGRLDAEYYYPAKERAIEILKELSDCTVGELFDSIRNLWQPDKGDSVDKVRNYDLSDALNLFLDDSKEPVERTAVASTKKIIRGGDLVVSRLRAYLKEIAVVKAGDETLMVVSTEFIVLRPKATTTLPVEALLMYLRSELPQLVFKWSQDGSHHPRFDEGELLRLPVPRALIVHGSNFVESIQTVIASRERANQLLEAAKRAVEIAIEQDEAAGMAYLANEGALA